MPDPSFVFAQSLSGLTAAMFLFLIASGLSLIFGVLRVLNFAHGTFYMLGAYCAFQLVQWIGTGPGSFWLAALGAALAVAALGGIVERFLFQYLYGKDELYQLLFTYALVLILSDVTKIFWGTQQKSVSRPPGLTGAFSLFGATIPYYNLFILLLGPVHRPRLLVRAPAHPRGALHPCRRARPGDAGRPRGERPAGSTPACSSSPRSSAGSAAPSSPRCARSCPAWTPRSSWRRSSWW